MLFTALFFVIGVISMFVLADGKEEYNSTIKDAWDDADRKFTNFVRYLKEERATNVADRIASIFGFVAALSFAASFLLMLMKRNEVAISLLFVYSFSAWIGIKWYTKGEAWKFFGQMLTYPLMFFAVPVMDVLTSANMTYVLAQPIDPVFQQLFGFSPLSIQNIWLLAVLQAALIAFIMIFMFGMMSIIFFPVIVSAVAIGLASIWFARALHSISGNRPIRPFMVLLGVLSLAYFSFK